MTIKEIETLSGMERANIRFYEREGFIAPRRIDNGYRDYSQDDLHVLLRVKLLRSLHIPLSDIRSLKDGSKCLADTLLAQIEKLELEIQGASYAQDVCRAMRADEVTFADLDARKYLSGIERASKETGNPYFAAGGDKLPQVFHPWRRYLARMLDFFLYNVLWSAFLAFVFNINLAARSGAGSLLDVFAASALMLALEPLLLRFFGATPGKAILGLKIETPEGGRLSYSEGLSRTWGVFGAGMGYNVPVYSMIRSWKSYKRCGDGEVQPWDESISYTIKDTQWYRSVFLAGAFALVFGLLAATMAAQMLPPNRGNLTVSEFAENFNYYSRLLGTGYGDAYLDDCGQWATQPSDSGAYIDWDIERPTYAFTVEDGLVTGVSFTIEQNDRRDWLTPYNTQMALASLAFAGAQKETGLFSKIPGRIADHLKNNAFKNFSFAEAGIAFFCETEYWGYADTLSGFLVPEENAAKTYFKLEFIMTKLK